MYFFKVLESSSHFLWSWVVIPLNKPVSTTCRHSQAMCPKALQLQQFYPCFSKFFFSTVATTLAFSGIVILLPTLVAHAFECSPASFAICGVQCQVSIFLSLCFWFFCNSFCSWKLALIAQLERAPHLPCGGCWLVSNRVASFILCPCNNREMPRLGSKYMLEKVCTRGKPIWFAQIFRSWKFQQTIS